MSMSSNPVVPKDVKARGSWSIIKEVWVESLRCTPWVFKKLTLSFGLVWLPIIIVVTILLNLFGFGEFPIHPALSHPTINFSIKDGLYSGFHLFELCFTIFIVPYFVYAFIKKEKGESVIKFRDFIAETVFPLVINHIKTFFVIFAFFLLLIIPGLIKVLRLFFVTQATFFDEDCLKKQKSALKASHSLTKGHLGTLILFMLLYFVFIIAASALSAIPAALLAFSFEAAGEIASSSAKDIVIYGADFYEKSFSLILTTQLYFALSKAKNQKSGG